MGSLEFGGISKVYMNLFPELIKLENVQIDLFLLNSKGEFLEDVSKDIKVYISEGSILKRMFNYIKYLLKEKPDYSISTRQRLDIINIICCLISFYRTKSVITIHTNLSEEIQNNSNSSSFYPVFSRLLYKIPNKYIAVSKGVKYDFCRRTKVKREKVKIIYNAVPPYNESMQGSISPIFKKILEKKEKFIISAGRFSEAKDYLTLIEALAIVRRERIVNLVLLGDGPLRSQYENLIHRLKLDDCVYLLGYVDNPQTYIKEADLFVLSSIWEGFPTVLLESMGVGTPIVATDCPSGPKEILKGGELGKLVTPGNPEELAKGILESLENSVKRELLIARSMEFQPHVIAEEYYNYLYN